MRFGHLQPRSKVRGELRNWREVHLRETSYFTGQIYNDTEKRKRDGSNLVTGFILNRLDRGDYWLVQTVGQSVYMLFKHRAHKEK
jgi:hypothetical protein